MQEVLPERNDHMPLENQMPEPIKEYYIAYFDLLGYKDFFRTYPERVGEFLQEIHDAVSHAKKYTQEIDSSFVGKLGRLAIKTKIFSDNILLCLEVGEEKTAQIEYPRFLAFLAIVADIQRNFILNYNLFLRGGVTIGTLSYNDDFIFGQGLIDAVALEENAVYPRIILGEAVKNYVLQPHFVDQGDLNRACEIERCAHSGEYITDEELAFCNSLMPAVDVEKYYLAWRNQLLFPESAGCLSLNYLYSSAINNTNDQTTIERLQEILTTVPPRDYQKVSNSSPDQVQQLERHSLRIIEKIKKFGKYDDLDAASEEGVKQAAIREHILKKYLWVMMFHNSICIKYDVPSCLIKSGSTCDIRFMRMTTIIYDDGSPEVTPKL